MHGISHSTFFSEAFLSSAAHEEDDGDDDGEDAESLLLSSGVSCLVFLPFFFLCLSADEMGKQSVQWMTCKTK